jgi:hypothetical protein
MARTLISIGVLLVIIGLLWPWLKNIPLGRLPGDIIIHRPHFRLYFPVTSSIVVSLLLALLLWLFRGGK